MNGGDAGGLLKSTKFCPQVEFVRSTFFAKQKNSEQHSDVPSSGNSKQLVTFVVTTGFTTSYTDSFHVKVFNIQKPSIDCCPGNYSNEYFTKIVVQRKINA